MIIKDRIVQVFDVEDFPNVFTCTIKNTETKEVNVFEFSHRTGSVVKEARRMKKLFLDERYLFCGYNNIHYDNPMVNAIINYADSIPEDYLKVCARLAKLSNTIINSDDFESWKTLKYANNFMCLDLLTMLFSQKLRVGLKEMQVTMQYHNVQEYEGDFNAWLPDDEIDNMLKYNLNDVESTEELLYRCKEQIDLRIGIQEEFGVDVLSKDDVSIGTEILKVKYLEATGKQWYEIKDLRSPCDIIDLNEVIFPFISYDTPVLQNLLDEMKQQKVSPGRKGYEKHFLLDNVEVTVGVGGIHTKNSPETIIPNEDDILVDSDVNSLYPSLIIQYKIVPKQLGDEFLPPYTRIYTDRLAAKKVAELYSRNMAYKFALNGASGNYQNEHSWMYDPIAVMRIRINGQLLLLKLAEMLLAAGARMKQLNTDGILYTISKSVDCQSILAKWENMTRLTLETEEYEAFYQYAINDYIAVGKGYSETKDRKLIKQKGLFIDKVKLGKGMQPMIIPEALNRYFVDKVPVEETVRNCKDIHKFITYQKVDKKFSVEYNSQIISRINRYYVSTGGYYLYKCIVDDKGKRTDYTNMLKASGVRIVNNLDEVKEFPKDINYRYYISECYKIIAPFECVQLTLFD